MAMAAGRNGLNPEGSVQASSFIFNITVNENPVFISTLWQMIQANIQRSLRLYSRFNRQKGNEDISFMIVGHC